MKLYFITANSADTLGEYRDKYNDEILDLKVAREMAKIKGKIVRWESHLQQDDSDYWTVLIVVETE